MDLDSSRVLQEVQENSAITGVLAEIFETEATEETERSANSAFLGEAHNAVIYAARATAFRSVVNIITEYGKNDNG